MKNEKPIIILGNGGHSKVLTEIVILNKRSILGFTAPFKEKNAFNIPFLGEDSSVFEHDPSEIELVNGIGSTQSTHLRKNLYELFKNKGYHFANIIHPSVICSEFVQLEEGVQIMAGAVIQPFVKIGENTIINTSTSIDHDCKIGSHCHIAPGTVISGSVNIGDETHVGSGTTIIQNVKIGQNVLIGAGSLVLRNINSHRKVYGVPVKDV